MRLRDVALVVALTVSAIAGAVGDMEPAWVVGQLVMALVIVRTA